VIVVNVVWFFVSPRLPRGVALRAAGFDVVVAAAPTGYARAIEEAGLRFVPLPLHRSGRAPWREASSAAAIVALYRRERPDVVHHVTIKPVLYGSLAAPLLGGPAILNAGAGAGVRVLGASPGPPPAARRAHRP